ncbi:Protease Do-like 10, mitochondrial [Chlamydiales bacterium SCGC AB-751-O23]|nr:Protease Do-like 10, mitochondrial [Chlamydiales bacterium SCGC AB-751-O23]
MRKHAILFTLILCSFFPQLSAGAEKEDVIGKISTSIVRVFCTSNVYNFDSPWQPPFQIEGTGSASVIGNGEVLTNAHVVAGGVSIYLKREDDVNLYPAKIIHIEHDYDLALLKVEDPSFLKGINPIEIGDMPYPRDEIYTLGYPTGGEKLSVTKGVVSRTEMHSSIHSGMKSMFTQIDASINPGNSGGAVVRNGKLVGVATQGMPYAQNIGYMVPQITVLRFLHTVKNKMPSSLPSLDISVQDFRNPDLRGYINLEKEKGGILVSQVHETSVAKGVLEDLDVILSLDGHKVESDNTYEWREGERISALNLIKTHLIGETIKAEIFRKGEVLEKEIVLRNSINDSKLATFRSFGEPPSYFLWGSLVFQPLSENYLGTWGDEWFSNAPKALISHFMDGEKTEERKQIVLLSRILPHKSNIGYSQMGRGLVVEKLNGREVKDLKHLQEMLKIHSEPYIILELEDKGRIILEAKTVKESHKEVMTVYGIYNDHSSDLD